MSAKSRIGYAIKHNAAVSILTWVGVRQLCYTFLTHMALMYVKLAEPRVDDYLCFNYCVPSPNIRPVTSFIEIGTCVNTK